MGKKLAALFCLVTILIVGSLVFITNQTIDFPTLFFALKIIIPAGLVSYFCALYLGKTLETSKGDTNLINTEKQQQFIDDLLLDPDQVLTGTPFIQVHQSGSSSSNEDNKKEGNENETSY